MISLLNINKTAILDTKNLVNKNSPIEVSQLYGQTTFLKISISILKYRFYFLSQFGMHDYD